MTNKISHCGPEGSEGSGLGTDDGQKSRNNPVLTSMMSFNPYSCPAGEVVPAGLPTVQVGSV